jgi:hypothetical protein
MGPGAGGPTSATRYSSVTSSVASSTRGIMRRQRRQQASASGEAPRHDAPSTHHRRGISELQIQPACHCERRRHAVDGQCDASLSRTSLHCTARREREEDDERQHPHPHQHAHTSRTMTPQ